MNTNEENLQQFQDYFSNRDDLVGEKDVMDFTEKFFGIVKENNNAVNPDLSKVRNNIP